MTEKTDLSVSRRSIAVEIIEITGAMSLSHKTATITPIVSKAMSAYSCMQTAQSLATLMEAVTMVSGATSISMPVYPMVSSQLTWKSVARI